MIYPPLPPPPPVVPRLHRRSLALAVLSGLALLIAGGAALLLFMNAQGIRRVEQSGLSLQYAWILGAAALVQIPGLVFSLARLAGKPLPEPRSPWFGLAGSTLLMIVAWPLAIWGNSALGRNTGGLLGVLSWLLQVLAVGIPLLWLVQIGRRGLAGGSAQRAWGVAGVSTAITVPLIVILEAVGAVALMAAALLFLAAREPGLTREIQRLLTQTNLGESNPLEILQVLNEYINPQQISLGVLAGVAVLAPMLEELLKPLALWGLVRKDFSPSQGFAAGLVAGAGFAMMESLQTTTLVSSLQGAWALSILLRAGTGAVHIACSGLVGWGLGEAWKNGRYLRLGGLFLLALIMHGTWNALALGPTLNTLLGGGDAYYGGLPFYSIAGMVTLLLFSLGVLAFGNKVLRAQENQINHRVTENTEEEKREELREEEKKEEETGEAKEETTPLFNPNLSHSDDDGPDRKE